MNRDERTSLRGRLRQDTRASHEALDEVVSGFDLATPTGFVRFLQMQVAALGAIAPHAPAAATNVVVSDLLTFACRDLRTMGQALPPPVAMVTAPHALAIDYVVAGSRLGTQVLRQRWQSAQHAQIRRADAYFAAPSHIDIWQSFCATTGAMPASGDLADQIVGDAETLFDLYQVCARDGFRAPQSQDQDGAINA